MKLIDTHTHLYLEQFDNDIDEVIKRALENKVEQFFLPNIDSTTIAPMMDLVSKYPDNCFPTVGLHATSVKENFKEELKIVEQQLENNKFYAIGEIGIDLYWDKTFLQQQEEAFEYQIELAKKHDLPIIIHARKSFNQIFNIIDKLNDDKLTGIFHCFGGSFEQANKIIDYKGFKLGIGGVLTFKNSKLGEVLKNVDLEHIVLETDAPFLAPSPFRGKRNESSYILNIAEKLAEIKNISLKKIAEITSKNAENLFF